MTAIISEFHSVTYQCKSSLHISEINIRKDNDMAPQQHDALPKSSDMETKDPLKSSPVSNLGTSVDSSPPQTTNKDVENANEYEMEQARAFDPSSEDSGSISSMADQDEFHQSPLEQLQYTFGKNGLLPRKSPLTNYSSEKMRSSLPADMREFRDLFPSASVGIYNRNVSSVSGGMFNRTMPSTTVGMYERNMPSTSAGIFNRDVTTSSAAMFNGDVQTSPAGIFARDIPSSSAMFSRNIPSTSAGVSDRESPVDIYSKTIPCHLCEYVSASKEEHDAHMNEHFEYKCTQCTYASRTEGRLKRHIKDFHSDTPPESWSGSKIRKKSRSNSVESMENCVTSSNGKSRQFKCKHCDFICSTKNDFWNHAKTHMKPDKILQCPHCEFASEFKHHYEYHLANHFGRKPFKCSMCNYKCVNKSMLNSHMKSHSNVYQFRCATCSYVTKYCHSIKQHLKTKQGHEAGPILNQDGSPSTIQMIDVYGRRRGPRAKKRKGSENLPNSASSPVSTNQQIMPFSTSVSMLPAAMYPSMEYASNFFMGGTHQLNPAYPMHMPLQNMQFGRYECTVCRHVTNDMESLNRHIMTHAGDYPDIAKLYGINPKIVQNPQVYRDAICQRNYLEHIESNIENSEKVSSSNVISPDGKHESVEGILDARSIKSEERSSPDYRRHSSSSPRNGESYKEFSSPSPTHSSASLNDYLAKKQDTMVESMVRTSEALSMEVESCRQPSGNDTPIDLSSPKSDTPKSDKGKDAVNEHQPSDLKCVSPRNIEPTNITTTNRHRRKGKAFKLDHYMQYNEQQEIVKRESGEVQLIGSYKDETMEDIEQLWSGKPEQKKEQAASEKHSKSEIQKTDTSDKHYSNPREPTNSQNSHEMMAVQSANILNGNHKFSNSTNMDSQPESVIPNEPRSQSEPSAMSVKVDEKNISSQPTSIQRYDCTHCATTFSDWFIYSLHMGFHTPQDPFTCKFCGCITKDATQFYIHLVRSAH